LGIIDIDPNHQLSNFEQFDLEEDGLIEENDQSKDASVNRTTSIYVSDDVWNQLAAVNGDNINPFFLNPEDRFGGAGVSTVSPLTPIQEVPPSSSSVGEDKSPGTPEQSSSADGSPSLGARTRALRRPERFQAVSPIPSAPQDRRLLLATLLARLNANSDIDNHMFRKLCYLSKETPLSAGAESADIWENGDRFSELITALLVFLENPLQNNSELKENALQLLQQLLLNQTEYVQGMERDLLRILLECRADPANNVCGKVDEILDTYVQIVDPLLGLYSLIDIMESRSAFVVLAKLVKRFDQKSLERQVGRILPLAIRGFNDPKAEIRKSIVEALVSIYSVIGDDSTMFQYLSSLNSSQQNLIKYYFKRASVSAHGIQV
ncbi:13115_t:CDS:2, partial [Ambispora gerdemannii]